jgi:two-component system nitrogen regulation sensor histidine kinase GlnL
VTFATDTLSAADTLLEQLSTAVILLDQQQRVRYANPAAEQLFATSRAHFNGNAIADFYWQDPCYLDALRNALVDKRSYTRREARLYFPASEQVVTLDYTVTPLAMGQEFLLELIPQDRILRISREDSLFTANQATQALVRGVAHEVRNPLGGIRGATQLLARELHDPSQHEYTDLIISEVDRLSHLVERMLGSHKMLDFKPINIHQVLERVYWVLKAEVGDNIAFVRDYDPSLPELWADLDQLIQVVLNIARNAAQALQENPSTEPARIILRTRVLRQYTLGNTCHRMVCLVEIEDNGPGIHAELQETLFYPMVTGRAQGTGLGLPIAQGIMQQHSGLIECLSQPKQTVFRILIPFEHNKPSKEPA